jgi:hypothetical protein
MPESTPKRESALRPALIGAGAAVCVMMALGAGPRDRVPNLPNASAQRLAMIEELKEISARFDTLEETLLAGDIVVKVSEIPEVSIAE